VPTLLDNERQGNQDSENTGCQHGDALQIRVDVLVVLSTNRLRHRHTRRSGTPAAAACGGLYGRRSGRHTSLALRAHLLAPPAVRRASCCLPTLRHISLHSIVSTSHGSTSLGSTSDGSRGDPLEDQPATVPPGGGLPYVTRKISLMPWEQRGQSGPSFRPSWAFSFPCSSGSCHP
jgi:hypothetical protein